MILVVADDSGQLSNGVNSGEVPRRHVIHQHSVLALERLEKALSVSAPVHGFNACGKFQCKGSEYIN